MKTVGALLKNAREEKGLSVAQIADQTKIKEKFLIALEESHWATLPNFPIASGFVKSYVQIVGVDLDHALALLRRDFPAAGYSELDKTQEMPMSSRFIWTPRATVVASLAGAFLLVGIYLFHQYMLFVAPPPLSVETTKNSEGLLVSGKTAPNATVEVNKRQVLLEKDGKFTIELDSGDLGEKVEIRATSRSGKSTVVEKPTN